MTTVLRPLPVSRPSTGVDELAGLDEVLGTGWLGHGAVVLEFERRLSAMFAGRHVVAVNTGTSALHLALDALGIGAGTEVIVPSFTFCASVQAITAAGATPVFCEVEHDTLRMDVRDVTKRITPRTRALMPVHYCGIPCDMDAVLSLAEAHGLRVVEDAAHAFGSATAGGRDVGSFGDIACFSFDPIKNITCGEGGAVVLDDPDIAELLRRKRMLGMNRDRWARGEVANGWEYEVATQGYRYHMPNLNAAIGLAQLGRMDAFRARKREIVRRYNECFCQISALALLDWDLTLAFPFSYVARVTDGRRDDLRIHLRERGVGSAVHYVPNHLQPQYSASAVPLPVTERVFGEVVSLPLYVDMTDDDVAAVIDAVESFFAA